MLQTYIKRRISHLENQLMLNCLLDVEMFDYETGEKTFVFNAEEKKQLKKESIKLFERINSINNKIHLI
jgi:hypothetical protein